MKDNGKAEVAEADLRQEPLISQFSNWVQMGTENFFAAQRILLDLVMRQNAMAMNALRGRLAASAPASAILSDVAGEGFANFVAAQEILLDLAKQQNDIVMTGVMERVGAGTPAAAMAEILRRSVETFIDLQEHFLTTAYKQSKAWVESVKSGQPYAGKTVAELAQEGIENVSQAQKKLLDVIAEEAAKAGKYTKAAPGTARKPALTELARQSAEAFIDVQKELLSTAGRQFEANLKAGGDAAGMFTPPKGTTLGELTWQGVENFVNAQKALLDLMINQRPAPAKKTAKEHARAAAHHVGAR